LNKGVGGAVELIENPQAFERWMIAWPDKAYIVHQFKKNFQVAVIERNPTTQ